MRGGGSTITLCCGLAGLATAALVSLAAGRATGLDAGAARTSGAANVLASDLLDAGAWQAAPADGVELSISADRNGEGRPALRLDYDFHGHGGWAAARRKLDLELPADYEVRFSLRGEGPPNHLEVKLVDPSGENVWWHVERDVVWPAEWRPVKIKKRQIAFAWGPAGGGEIRRLGTLEITVTAGAGGKGSVWIAGLELRERPPAAPAAGPPTARANSEEHGHVAANALDGDLSTSWRPTASQEPAELTVDLGTLVEIGGVTLTWERQAPRRFRLDLSEDGKDWTAGRIVERGGGRQSDLLLTESEARFLRLRIDPKATDSGEGGPAIGSAGLAELIMRPLAFGATPNDFFREIAKAEPRGAYPRGFSGEQVYWTVVGADGGRDEALFSEDGALEVGEGGFSVEPFVRLDGKLWSWADITAEQSLADGDLPIPTVAWPLPGARLEVTTLAADGQSARDPRTAERSTQTGTTDRLSRGDRSEDRRSDPDRTALFARYRLRNASGKRLTGRLFLAARPLQVDPPTQFLNQAGGTVRLAHLACAGSGLNVEGSPRLSFQPRPAACGAAAFDEGPIVPLLATGAVPAAPEVDDSFGYATAALAWDFDLQPGASFEVVLGSPFAAAGAEAVTATRKDVEGGASGFTSLEEQTRRRWRETLDRVRLDLPAEAEPLARAVRTSLAYELINRDGPALQPGSRSYARSWIRDGSLTGTALLRLGDPEPAREFAEWFAGFQYPDGKVPCCVDHRGADPVPEHDSHGELIHVIAEVFRYTGDRAFAERMFRHVAAAVDHIESLRQSRRTAAYRSGEKQIFFGLLPESISHEGYSAKPVHSYWDDLFAYRGLDDAASLAGVLGRANLANRWRERSSQFRTDLAASLALVMKRRGISYLPGSADLGDFDSTSTTIALDPAGLDSYLPRAALESTFERFYQELSARRAGKPWEAFTPYEVRHVGAFLRLGWKARAHELLSFYLDTRRPAAWNQWPEVVRRNLREPAFLGDLPHGWVASDFIRSVLDLFAYERRQDESLVLAAGVPTGWLERPQGISVHGLASPWGPVDYSLARRAGRAQGVRYTLAADCAVPPGGLVLAWPLAGRPVSALVAGQPAALTGDGSVVVHRAGVTVDLLGGKP